MAPICFIDGAQFGDIDGFLVALHQGVLGVPDEDEAFALLLYLFHGAARGRRAGRLRLHVVWLNSEVSRRRLAADRGENSGPGSVRPAGWSATTRRTRWSFADVTRCLAGLPGIDLILL